MFKRSRSFFSNRLDGPLLDTVRCNINKEKVDFYTYPFTLPIIRSFKYIKFPTQVTFFVGENGSGKSTLLEAIACHVGAGREGGSKNIHFKTSHEKTYTGTEQLAEQLTLSWRQKPQDYYYFRAESFFNIANFLDDMGQDALIPYGGISLHEQSHGEAFLAFFTHRIGNNGFYMLDEPEAALSPQRQLALISILYDICKKSNSQFIIATHSPLLLAYPQATIYSFENGKISSVKYKDTEHYRITKTFLNNPEQYIKHLIKE